MLIGVEPIYEINAKCVPYMSHGRNDQPCAAQIRQGLLRRPAKLCEILSPYLKRKVPSTPDDASKKEREASEIFPSGFIYAEYDGGDQINKKEKQNGKNSPRRPSGLSRPTRSLHPPVPTGARIRSHSQSMPRGCRSCPAWRARYSPLGFASAPPTPEP